MDNIWILYLNIFDIHLTWIILDFWPRMPRPPDIHGSKTPFPEKGRCPNPSRRRQGMVTGGKCPR